MASLTRCNGTNCLIKETCKRYIMPSPNRTFFAFEPFKIKNGVFKCEFYWGEKSEGIMAKVEEIMNINTE